MSRIAAYIGSSLSLEGFLSRPDQSIYQQSLNNEDISGLYGGFGFGWYNPGSKSATYVNPDPVWKDQNLPNLMKSLRRRIWIAHAESGLMRHSATAENSQPFCNQHLLWAHSGYVANFISTLRPHCLRYLAPQIESEIEGHTDSEYLFALLRQRMMESDNVGAPVALAEIMSTLEVTLRDIEARLNIVISDGDKLYAIRHATNIECEPLYYTENDAQFPTDGKLIASAPLTSEPNWVEVPEHHILVLSPEEPAELVRL